MVNHSVNFFDTQFQNQVNKGDFSLNPFEQLALPFLKGKVLDLGCGLGNLSIEAARRGAKVLALDASETAVEYITGIAIKENLTVQAQLADLSTYKISENYDVIVSIGLLMFMEKSKAYEMLENIKLHVVPGGYAIINVLIDTTTYLDMFDLKHYYLFGHHELQEQFAGWQILESKCDNFEAPSSSIKAFTTLVAHKH
ncbi:MAG: methyltransferase domain-containing protein [Blastocatellia bacterium]|nr:methyltransferase domain-containing protein [Blastocatellia bacterium]